jgi:AcrR family transcriptional regulator
MPHTDVRAPRQDPRPARTRAAILEAVEQLLTRGEREVTVNAIASEAGISRSTFYTQFRDLDELAGSLMSNAFSEIALLDLQLRDRLGATETARRTTTELVAHVDDRRALYAAVLNWSSGSAAQRAAHSAFTAQALRTMRDTAPAGVDPRRAAEYVAAGSLAILTRWVVSEPTVPAAEIQHHLVALLPSWLTSSGGSAAAPA